MENVPLGSPKSLSSRVRYPICLGNKRICFLSPLPNLMEIKTEGLEREREEARRSKKRVMA
jgi:hypothetical protein